MIRHNNVHSKHAHIHRRSPFLSLSLHTHLPLTSTHTHTHTLTHTHIHTHTHERARVPLNIGIAIYVIAEQHLRYMHLHCVGKYTTEHKLQDSEKIVAEKSPNRQSVLSIFLALLAMSFNAVGKTFESIKKKRP